MKLRFVLKDQCIQSSQKDRKKQCNLPYYEEKESTHKEASVDSFTLDHMSFHLCETKTTDCCKKYPKVKLN